jgi:hypothetical protein
MQKCTEFREFSQSKCRGIPQNFAEFPILIMYQKIPYSAGSKKTTSMDTLGPLWQRNNYYYFYHKWASASRPMPPALVFCYPSSQSSIGLVSASAFLFFLVQYRTDQMLYKIQSGILKNCTKGGNLVIVQRRLEVAAKFNRL